MQKVRKYVEIIVSVGVLIYATLYMFKIDVYAPVIPYIFIGSGVIFLVGEMNDRHSKKPVIRLALLLFPILLIALAIESMLTGSNNFVALCLVALATLSFQKTIHQQIKTHEQRPA